MPPIYGALRPHQPTMTTTTSEEYTVHNLPDTYHFLSGASVGTDPGASERFLSESYVLRYLVIEEMGVAS